MEKVPYQRDGRQKLVLVLERQLGRILAFLFNPRDDAITAQACTFFGTL